MDFRPVADDYIGRLREVRGRLGARGDAAEVMDLEPVVVLAERFKGRAEALEQRRCAAAAGEVEDVARLNGALKQLSRVLTWVRGTVSGRYGQDTYGLTVLRHDIPNLEVVEHLLGAAPESHEFYLWATTARRERNKVSEALRRATAIIDGVLS
jgi:predicted Zn-dependent protease